jgi:tetratricopeptide (TPR) repeat protein
MFKAFDLYYKYQDRATKEEVFAMFKEAMDTDGLKTADFVINPFTALLIEMYDQGKVSDEEAKKYEQQIRAILAEGLKDCEGVACDRWKIIEEYAPNRLQYFETVEGFYDCEYYMDRYYPEFLAAQEDCDVIRTVYSRLKWGMCTEMDERFKELIRVGNENCVVETAGPAKIAYNCLKEADYQCAIDGFIEAANNTDDTEKKGQYLLIVAKIYQAHLRNFSKSRQFALDAAEVRPNWGEPYLHIGRLYASSGPLCGPGRGWDSQIVVWPAIDMWNKAKQVDPEAAAEANKWIGQYAQYMPKKEDVFIRNLKAGDSFFVPCWIQRSTRIRTAD